MSADYDMSTEEPVCICGMTLVERASGCPKHSPVLAKIQRASTVEPSDFRPIRSGVPNKPKTKTRGIRIPDDEWVAAQETAERRGETVTDEVRRALRAYVRRNR